MKLPLSGGIWLKSVSHQGGYTHLRTPAHTVTTRGHSRRPTAWFWGGTKIMGLGFKTTSMNSANVNIYADAETIYVNQIFLCIYIFSLKRMSDMQFTFSTFQSPFLSHTSVRVTCLCSFQNSRTRGGPQRVKKLPVGEWRASWAQQNAGPWGSDMWWCFVRGNGMYLHGQIHQSQGLSRDHRNRSVWIGWAQ